MNNKRSARIMGHELGVAFEEAGFKPVFSQPEVTGHRTTYELDVDGGYLAVNILTVADKAAWEQEALSCAPRDTGEYKFNIIDVGEPRRDQDIGDGC